MRILVVQETDWLKRGPHQQHHLFERLSVRGHDITVVDYPILREHWPAEPAFVPRVETENAARIINGASIRLITPSTLSFAPLARSTSVISHYTEISQLVRESRPDVIVSYALSTGMPALRVARKYGIPFVFHVIDALHTIVPSKALQPVARRVEQELLKASDRVILINEHLRDYAVRMGAEALATTVLRTGVDLDRFAPVDRVSAERQTVRAELGFHADELILFFMGWIYDFSGVREVAASLESAPQGVRLLVVGDGDDYEALQTMRDTQLGDRLVLTGRVPYDSIPRLLTAADVCLLPFHTVPATENIVPIKLYEYMASGRAVIASPLPGVQRDIGEGHGLTYTPAEKQVEAAVSIRDQIDELGRKSRAFVEQNCDWEIVTSEFESLLTEAAGMMR